MPGKSSGSGSDKKGPYRDGRPAGPVRRGGNSRDPLKGRTGYSKVWSKSLADRNHEREMAKQADRISKQQAADDAQREKAQQRQAYDEWLKKQHKRQQRIVRDEARDIRRVEKVLAERAEARKQANRERQNARLEAAKARGAGLSAVPELPKKTAPKKAAPKKAQTNKSELLPQSRRPTKKINNPKKAAPKGWDYKGSDVSPRPNPFR